MPKENKTPNLFVVKTNVVPISHRREALDQEIAAQLNRSAIRDAMMRSAKGEKALPDYMEQKLFNLAEEKAREIRENKENKGGDER